MERSLEKLLIMIQRGPTKDPQGLLEVGLPCRKWRYWKGESSLSLHFLQAPPPFHRIYYKIRKVLCFLVDCDSSWIAMGSRDCPVQHGETFYYIRCGWYWRRWCSRIRDIRNENGWRTYLKAKDDIIIETLDTDYEDIESLNNLDVINTM